MFDVFAEIFPPDAYEARPTGVWTGEDTEALVGSRPRLYTEFVQTIAQPSYGSGLVRFLLPGTSPSLIEWNGPEGWVRDWSHWRGRLVVFGFDWLGRQLAFDKARIDPATGEPLIALLEPGFGDGLEIPCTFADFIGRELPTRHEAALVSGFHQEWLASGGRALRFRECAGYQVPPFLGGADDPSNLEVADMDVYVSLTGQLYRQSG